MALSYFGSAAAPADLASEVAEPVTSTVTPPGSMVANDFVLLFAHTRGASTPSIADTGGQAWDTSGGLFTDQTAALNSQRVWVAKAVFDGTWDANPQVAFGAAGGTIPVTAIMHVFRSSVPGTWAVERLLSTVGGTAFSAPSSPFTVTITSPAVSATDSISIGIWACADDNTWGSLSGTGWVVTGTAQYRNSAGSDQSISFAHNIRTSPGTPANPSKNMNASDAGLWEVYVITFTPASIDPGVGAGTLTGFAPVLANSIAIGLAALTATGFAPTVGLSINAGVGAGTLAGFAPTVATTSNQVVLPGLGEAIANGFAPILDLSIGLDVGALTANGFAPTVQVATNVLPSLGELAAAGFSPTVATSNHQNVLPGLGDLTATGLQPTVSATDHKNVLSGLGELAAAGLAPTVAVSNNQNVQAGLGIGDLTGFAPTIVNPQSASPGLGEVAVSGFAPTITAGAGAVPDTGLLVLAGFAPTVSATEHVNALPGLGQLIAFGFFPTVDVTSSANAQPGTGLAVLSGHAPVVTSQAGASTVTRIRLSGRLSVGTRIEADLVTVIRLEARRGD